MPTPVSHTVISIKLSARCALIPTWPLSGVNFTALESRLKMICFTLRSSAVSAYISSLMSSDKRIPCDSARSFTTTRLPSSSSRKLTVPSSSSILPASILERSRMSLIRLSRCFPLVKMSFRYSSCFSLISPNIFSSSTSEKPMMEFNGVRSSCDMLARNCDLCWLAIRSRAAGFSPGAPGKVWRFEWRSRIARQRFAED